MLRTDSFCLRQKKKNFFYPTNKNPTKLKFRLTKDKRFHFITPKFFYLIGQDENNENLIYVFSLCVICGYPYIKAYFHCMYGKRNDKRN